MQGLGVLHSMGMVHGDIKPGNMRVRMQTDGTDMHLVLIDLGSCRKEGVSESPHSCCVACHPAFAEPMLTALLSKAMSALQCQPAPMEAA